MKDGKYPNPNTIHPIAGYDKEIYVKPTITNPNIIVGDFTYISLSYPVIGCIVFGCFPPFIVTTSSNLILLTSYHVDILGVRIGMSVGEIQWNLPE